MTNEEVLEIIKQNAQTRSAQLDLNGQDITELPPEIGQLTHLQRLYLKENKLTSLPPEIGQLTKLTRLYLSKNDLTSLPPEIGNLTKLDRIYLSKNKLSSLPPEIGQLTELEGLYLSDNELTSIPQEIKNLTKLTNLDLRKNKLSVSTDILEEIHKPSLIIKCCLESEGGGKNTLNQFKLILLGSQGVGKTSVLTQLKQEPFNSNPEKTQGVDFQSWILPLQGEDIQVNVWELAIPENLYSLNQYFLTPNTLYLLIVDATQGEKTNKAEYWLKQIQEYAESSPVIIVGNKTDQNLWMIDRGRLNSKYKNIKTFIEISCQTGNGIEQLTTQIKKEITSFSHFQKEITLFWFQAIEKITPRLSSYLPQEEYEPICQKEGIATLSEQRQLVSLLRDLGIVLCFQSHPLLKDKSLVNYQWFNNTLEELFTSNYSEPIDFNSINQILTNKITREQFDWLMEILGKLELCFELDHQQHKFIIPHLLTPQEPVTEEWEDGLKCKYDYNISPTDIIARFIVREKQLIKDNIYWRNGVVLAKETNLALVKANLEEKSILIVVNGTEKPQAEFLNNICEEFKTIHQRSPGIQVKELRETTEITPEIETKTQPQDSVSTPQPQEIKSNLDPTPVSETQPNSAQNSSQKQGKLLYLVGLVVIMALITVISYSLKLPWIPILIIGSVLVIIVFFILQKQGN